MSNMNLRIKTDTVQPVANYHAFCSKSGITQKNIIKAIGERSFTVSETEVVNLFSALVAHAESSYCKTFWWWISEE